VGSVDVGIDDRLAAGLVLGALGFRGELKIGRHRWNGTPDDARRQRGSMHFDLHLSI
jgi:hypothetical protein